MLLRMNAEELPDEFGSMHFDRWTGGYHDNFNDIFVRRRVGRKQWVMSERGPGNRTILHSRHRDLEKALNAANALYARRHQPSVYRAEA